MQLVPLQPGCAEGAGVVGKGAEDEGGGLRHGGGMYKSNAVVDA